MRKTFIRMAFIAIVAGFAACTPKITFTESDLHGKWQEEDKNAYVVFTVEQDTLTDLKENGYHWGYEWDESEAVYEQDVMAEKYGNGWFLYTLEGAKLTEYHMMSNKGAYIPKYYTVSVLTNSDLNYQDEEKVAHSYKKVK